MFSRSTFKLAKATVVRFLATENAGAKYLSRKFDASFGAHCRAPSYKETCEDAYFIWSTNRIIAFGVADGVSSWRHFNTDPSLFPNMLMANCIKNLEGSQGKLSLKELLASAYNEILHKNQVIAGSSTACLGILDKEIGQLETLNLGDSGFCIFRNGQKYFKSTEQYQGLNVPFQIGVKEIVDDKAVPHGNSLCDAVVQTFDIEDDDLVVLGTDGLFDNMYPHDIFAAVSSSSTSHVIDWNGRAEELTAVALSRSVESKRTTPREERLQKYDDLLLIPGGNFDDVTAVLVHIKMH